MEDVRRWLLSICRKCINYNHKCIKDEAYIGLCVANDREELIEDYYEQKKREGE